MRKSVTGVLTILLILLMTGQANAAVHVVQPGESLWLISQKYNTSVSTLANANNLMNLNYIEAGQQLSVPGEPAPQPVVRQVVHTVRLGETLWFISRQYNATVAAIAAENNIVNVNLIKAGNELVIPGVSGEQAAPVLASRNGRNFTAAELDLFARLVFAESAGEPYLGQVAVAASVLNRVDSSLYPNTLTGVINQRVNGYYQYSPVLDGRINLPANDSARRAVQDAISGQDPSLGATGFYNPRKTTNVWVRQQPVTTTIGNHVFFR